jgi:hypothetical protein
MECHDKKLFDESAGVPVTVASWGPRRGEKHGDEQYHAPGLSIENGKSCLIT